jgi:hypothetical protein
MKQNKKAKNYAVFCFAGKKNLLFYIYAVIVKQKNYKRSTNHYSHCIASCAAQRTARMQPASAQRIASQTIRAPTTSPPRIARRARCASPAARRTPRTCISARASQYFALVSFGSWY